MPSVFEFGPFRLDPEESSLTREGTPVLLTPKALATLKYLVENAGRLVDKQALLSAVWPDTFVEEATLAQNISALRKALGDGYIETVPKRGYRFIAPVRQPAPGPVTAPVTPPPRRRTLLLAVVAFFALAILTAVAALQVRKSPEPPGSGRKSLAVLPFKPISNNPDDEYLGLAMSDALITRLGNVQQVIVRPTTAVRKYGGSDQDPIKAGRELETDLILDGTVQRSGDRMRVSVQMFDVESGAAVWSESFDVPFTDIFSAQDRLSGIVADAAIGRLSGSGQQRTTRHTDDREAYAAYVKGRYFWNKRTEEGYRRAIEHFNFALKRDPQFALAMSGLADAYALLGSMPTTVITRPDAMARARSLAQQALAIDDDIAEAHTSLAFVKMHYDWDWKGADAEFRRAIQLNPGYPTAHHWYAYYLLSQGRTDDAVDAIRRAEALDPLSLIISTDVAEVLLHARRFEEACRQIEKTLELDQHFPLAYRVAASCGDPEGSLRKSVLLGRDDSDFHLPTVYASMGRIAEANAVYDRLKVRFRDEANSSASLGLVAISIGRIEEGFRYLDKAVEERSGSLILMKVDFAFDGLRSDPRYLELLRRLGLPREPLVPERPLPINPSFRRP